MQNLVRRVSRKGRVALGYAAVNVKRLLSGVGSAGGGEAAAHFRDNGFIKFNEFPSDGLAEHLSPYIDDPARMEVDGSATFTVLTRNDRGIKSVAVDVNAPFLRRFVFTRRIYDLIYNYYGRHFFLRNNPTIEFNYPAEVHDAQKFHLDFGLRQVSVMFGLTDLDQKSTHMEYLLGSNRRYYFYQPHRDDPAEKARVDREMKRLPVDTTAGPRDTVSVFDAGCGYHRQMPGGARVMLHLNFVDNFAFCDWDPDWSPLNSNAYWFSRYDDATKDLLANSQLPESFFSLVLRRHTGGLGVPRVFSAHT